MDNDIERAALSALNGLVPCYKLFHTQLPSRVLLMLYRLRLRGMIQLRKSSAGKD